MSLPYVTFDSSKAKSYRKSSRVLAYRSDDAVTFYKPWGQQNIPEGSWILIPLVDERPTGDIYGCHPDAFISTYTPVDVSHVYEKRATVLAYRPGRPFAVRTTVSGFVETDPATGGATDWLVQNPGGEVYIVSDVVFLGSYVLVD